MKKLFNSRFLFILASSLIVLIVLIVGAFYLFENEDDFFVKSGYVLNPLSSTSEKYFFDENIGYRENLSSMVEFLDVDKNKVSILKDSFLHYMDDSLSFLKNGAILDLDSLTGKKAVSLYNITNESMIEKKDNGYVIVSSNGDIKLKNFIGRISDNKYIVVGDLSLKMAGNSTTVKGDYFEIVYVKEGIVNIENKSVKYQVAAEDTLIYVGSNKVIDLGDKKITANGDDVMSITAITINGDENIEIIPKAEEQEEDDDTGNNGGETEQPGQNPGGENSGENAGTPGEVIKEVMVTLKDADIGSTNVNVTFDVLNATDEDVFKLQVVNLTSGRTIDMVVEVLADVEIQVNLLTPSTKYLFMVINEKDNNKYFQKVFETTGFGIKLEKAYSTESSLAYNVVVDKGTDITNAKLSLYKFNEETMKNEIVTTSTVDSVTGETIYEEKVTYLSNLGGNIEGEHEIVFSGLENNMIYTAVLDEFSVASSNFKDIYNITLTSMTLKKTPLFSEMTIKKDVGEGSFDLSLGNITDPDSAIVGYTYLIYNKFDNELAVDPIFHSNASPLTVKIGDGENQLKNDVNYYYKVIIEYYDNEKYIEYVTSDSIIFNMGSDPYITVVPNNDLISYTQLGATIYLRDNSCLIEMPGREKCDGPSSSVVEVSKINSVTGERTPVYTKRVTFTVDGDEIKYDLFVDGLQAGTTYSVEVLANLSGSLERQEIFHTEESKRLISTKSFATLNVEWTNVTGYEEMPIVAKTKLYVNDNNSVLLPEETVESIKILNLKLYPGRNAQDIDTKIPIGTATFDSSNNIKANFYDKAYEFDNETFGLSLNDLISRSGGELNEYYTIFIEAYADDKMMNKIQLVNDVFMYRVAPGLFSKAETILEITPITKAKAKDLFKDLSNDGTVVGYNIYSYYDRQEMIYGDMEPIAVNYYVYNSNKKKINFYVLDENGNLKEVDKYRADIEDEETNFNSLDIYMDYGTSYEVADEVMRRGNSFYIGYEIVTRTARGEESLYPLANDGKSPSGYGMYKAFDVGKETPKVKMFIANTTKDSITYQYSLLDPDKAVYKELDAEDYGFYYIIGNGIENKVSMQKVSQDGEVDKYEGRITINGLKNKDKYSLYYKNNMYKFGNFTDDIFSYLDGGSVDRIFDGFYDTNASDNNYNFRYKIINNPLKDNKVVIKIMATEEMLDRILSYRITFKTKDKSGKEITLNKELWKLLACSGDGEGVKPRCLSVDYIELKNAGMKSDDDFTKLITVDIEALYDNGMTGFDFKVGKNDDDDYLYCILQDNSTKDGMGNYISFSSSGNSVTVWSESIEAPKGYYTYKLNQAAGQLTYTSQLTGSEAKIRVSLTGSGYSTKNGFVTPKMISVDNMSCTPDVSGNACNEFSFSSITPKIEVKEKTSIINGTIMNLTLSGIDLNDLKKDNDGEYYLYVETWDKISDIGKLGDNNLADPAYLARPTLKVKINSSNPTETVSAVIDGLKEYNAGGGNNTPTGTYYFNVYAYLNNGSVGYTQLFDAGVTDGYQTKSYVFKTLKAGDLFHSLDVGFSASSEVYGNRVLNTKINLLAYKNSTAYNFDIVYVLCNTEDAATCGPNDGDTNIFKKVIPLEELSTMIEDKVDISEYDLEYGKNYLLSVYANAKYYDSEKGNFTTKRNILINAYNRNVSLRKLSEPTFVVTRNAILDGSSYGIDFNVVVSDSDRTLVDGKYFVKLLDSSGNIVGNMKLTDKDGNYYDVANYVEYEFDAFVPNKKIRIVDLEPNKKYTFVVYNDAYLNNYSEDTLPGKEHRTYEVSKSYSVYSTNDYGVAFGDATYGVTEKSVVVTFLGGSNFENVTEVNYTVGLWDDEESSSTMSGTFVIGDNNKYFELYKNSEDWRFVIDPAGMKNVLGKTYKVNISFKVKIPGTNEYIVLTSADVPSFEGTVTYYEDDN